jgi:pimeloyl-ACP methyl ester carboxylesterase
VLLHGLGASSFSWRHNRARLSRHFRVITPDLPGHGRSPAPLNADYRTETLVRGLADFLDWHGLETVALGGNSLGGGLSLLLAGKQPARVSALVLMAPAAAMTRIPYAFWPLRLPVLGYAVASLLGPWLLPWFMRLVYCHPERLIPEAVAGYAPPYRDLNRRLALRQVCRELEIRPWRWALLRLAQPTTLIGETRPHLPGPGMDRALPQRNFLPEVGHAPQEEAPELVNKIIIDFLGRSIKNVGNETTHPSTEGNNHEGG